MTDPTPTTPALLRQRARFLREALPHATDFCDDKIINDSSAEAIAQLLESAAALLASAETRAHGLREALEALCRKWWQEAKEIHADGDYCCGKTRQHDADELDAALRTADAPPAPRLVTADDPLCPGDCIGNYADGVHGGRYPCEHNPNRAAVLRVHPDAETHDEDTAPAPAEGGAPPPLPGDIERAIRYTDRALLATFAGYLSTQLSELAHVEAGRFMEAIDRFLAGPVPSLSRETSATTKTEEAP